MKILLLQDERYLPTYGGSNKANRRLLEELSRRGHQCLAVCPSHNAARTTEPEFRRAFAERGIAVRRRSPWLVRYSYRGVTVDGLQTPDLERRAAHARERIAALRPDLVLVSDDSRRHLLRAALGAAPDRVVFLVHGHRPLPFGPLSANPERAQTEMLRRVRALGVWSRYSADYLARHAGLPSVQIAYPVDGPEPPPLLARFENPFVTMIQPTAAKGLGLFLSLADAFAAVGFAVVETWGGAAPDPDVLAQLRARPNVHVLAPADDIGAILAQTRVLLVPSLFPETFGLVALEAMARGVPVLASDAGGLPEAKLGLDYLLPVRPMEAVTADPGPQDAAPWAATLGALLDDRRLWERCSRESRAAALAHVAGAHAACDGLLDLLASPR